MSVRLLIVEDGATTGAELPLELGQPGRELRSQRVATEAELIEALDDGRWDAVIVDCRGSGLSALAALKIARERDPDLPFVVVPSVTGERELATQLRVTEEALERTQTRFRALIENSLDLFGVSDRKARFLYASPSFERVLGYRPDELVGRNAFDFVHPDDAAGVRDVFSGNVGASGAAQLTEYRFRHKDGGWRVLESLGSNLLDDPAVQGILVTSRDITSRRVLQERLEQTERLEAIGQLVAGVAHDYNNILLVIRGYGTLLLEKAREEGQRNDLLEIVKAADRATNLTRQLLAFGRRQEHKPQILEVATIAAELEPLLQRTIREDIDLSIDFDTAAPPVLADPVQIEQILVNLVVNARDAIAAGGAVTVTVREVTLTSDQAEHLAPPALAGSYVAVAVADTGAGIEPETLPHIFEPFFTTKPPDVGTGLGLSTVYGIVAQNGGGILVESTVGVGSTFTVHLPSATTAEQAGSAEPQRESATRPAERILLVEDERAVRDLVRAILEQRGYEVVAAARPSEALALSASGFDLLISDVVMPELNGYELAERLAVAAPHLRVLFISGDTRELGERVATETGRPLLKKPFTADELADRVRATLDEELPEPVPVQA